MSRLTRASAAAAAGQLQYVTANGRYSYRVVPHLRTRWAIEVREHSGRGGWWGDVQLLRQTFRSAAEAADKCRELQMIGICDVFQVRRMVRRWAIEAGLMADCPAGIIADWYEEQGRSQIAQQIRYAMWARLDIPMQWDE